MEDTNNHNPDSEMPFCLLWDIEREEYARVESPWSDEDLKSVARFEVRERFRTEEELMEALRKAKIISEENKKPTGKMGIIGAGNLQRTILHHCAIDPVILVDSTVNTPDTSMPPMVSTQFTYPINRDVDHNPIGKKMKKGSNFTQKKKKRKK